MLNDIYQDGRAGKRASKSNDCYEVNYTDTGFTTVFTNCEVDDVEGILNGTITATYLVGEEAPFMATYNNFMIDGIEINGTRRFGFSYSRNETANTFSISTITDMTIKLENGLLIQESGSRTFSAIVDIKVTDNNGFSLEGDWTVKVDDNTYVINVSSALLTNFDCLYFTDGALDLNKNGLQVSINFGDGTCDDIVELIYPDETKEEISLKD